MLNPNKSAPATEQRIVDCPDCDASGEIYAGLGYQRCRLCTGTCELAIVVATDSGVEAEWDAVHALREARMPELFMTDEEILDAKYLATDLLTKGAV